MVEEYFKKVMINRNIIDNLDFYQNLERQNQMNCDHIAINLGSVSNSKIRIGDELEPIEYKKCLLCGKNLSGRTDSIYREIKFFDHLNQEDSNIEDINNLFIEKERKYNYILQLFTFSLKQSSTLDEALNDLNLKLNGDTKRYEPKRSITKK